MFVVVVVSLVIKQNTPSVVITIIFLRGSREEGKGIACVLTTRERKKYDWAIFFLHPHPNDVCHPLRIKRERERERIFTSKPPKPEERE